MVLRCPHDHRISRQQITVCTCKEERAVSQTKRPALHLVDQTWSPAMVLGLLIDSGFSMHSVAKRTGRFTDLAQNGHHRYRSAEISQPRGQ
jgi:hypothetical protein